MLPYQKFHSDSTNPELMDISGTLGLKGIPPNTKNWPIIKDPFKRDGRFILVVEEQGVEMTLRLNPDNLGESDYIIRDLRTKKQELGKVRKITSIVDEEPRAHLKELTAHKIRYAVSTIENNTGNLRAWLVGINDFRSVSTTED
jgi:hypothetical protein